MLVVASACGSGSEPQASPTVEQTTLVPSTSATSDTQPAAETTSVGTDPAWGRSLDVGPETDTAVVLDDGATLTIPQGTVERQTTMTFERVNRTEPSGTTGSFDTAAAEIGPLPDSVVRVGYIYLFDADGYGDFSRAVTIALPYDETLIPEGLDESRMIVARFDGTGWVPILGVVDRDNRTISFERTHNLEPVTILIVTTVVYWFAAVALAALAAPLVGDSYESAAVIIDNAAQLSGITVEVNPIIDPPGVRTVRAEGFLSNEAVSFLFVDECGNEYPEMSGTSDSTGAYNASFLVSEGNCDSSNWLSSGFVLYNLYIRANREGAIGRTSFQLTAEVPQTGPCVPELIAPREGDVLDNGRIDRQDSIGWRFTWVSCPDAESYQLYVKLSKARFAVIDVTLTATRYDSNRPGAYIIDANRFGWTWKVRAKHEGQWGEWSETRTFDVEPVNTD